MYQTAYPSIDGDTVGSHCSTARWLGRLPRGRPAGSGDADIVGFPDHVEGGQRLPETRAPEARRYGRTERRARWHTPPRWHSARSRGWTPNGQRRRHRPRTCCARCARSPTLRAQRPDAAMCLQASGPCRSARGPTHRPKPRRDCGWEWQVDTSPEPALPRRLGWGRALYRGRRGRCRLARRVRHRGGASRPPQPDAPPARAGGSALPQRTAAGRIAQSGAAPARCPAPYRSPPPRRCSSSPSTPRRSTFHGPLPTQRGWQPWGPRVGSARPQAANLARSSVRRVSSCRPRRCRHRCRCCSAASSRGPARYPRCGMGAGPADGPPWRRLSGPRGGRGGAGR